MVSKGTDVEVAAFAARLQELLSSRGVAIRGRQTALAKQYKVSQAAARKWLEGEGLPKLSQAIQIARDFGTNIEWLLLGTGARDVQHGDPAAVLGNRIAGADDRTRRLVELALNEDDAAAAATLSPSLLAMVRMLKQAIAAEPSR